MSKTDGWQDDDGRLVAFLFAVGLAVTLWMIYLVDAQWDATCLLSRGWLLVQKGIWVPLGNPASGGGYAPGGLTALLVGLPLAIWMDHRAPVLLILLFHIAAYVLLDRLVKETLGGKARIVFAVFYWLNPWRLHQAAWLDNANYAFFVGAVHLWACWRQRHQSSFLHTFLLVAIVGLSVQLHLNALLLVFSAVLLWWRGYWKIHWPGAVLGAAVTFGTLVPFFLLAVQHPELVPINRDPVAVSLVRVSPVVKGFIYWFRYASLFASSQSIYAWDFTRSFGPLISGALYRIFGALGLGLGTLTVIIPVLANTWCWRRRRKTRLARRPAEAADPRTWLREYALWNLVACVLVNALSPAPAMWWHNLIALHAAILPVVLWCDALMRTRRERVVRRGLTAFAALSLLLLVGVAIGGEQFLDRGGVPERPDPSADLEIQFDLPIIRFNSDVFPRRPRFFYQNYMHAFRIPSVEEETHSGETGAPKVTPAEDGSARR